MAFMGIFLMFLVVFLAIIGFCTIVAIILFAVGMAKRSKSRREAAAFAASPNFKPSKGYRVMLVLSGFFMIPLVGTIFMILYSVISSKVENNSSLYYNVMHGNYEKAERLLEKGASPDCTEESNDPAQNGEKTLLHLMCENEGFIDFYDSAENDGFTEEEREMMQLLIDHGADIEYKAYSHEKSAEEHQLDLSNAYADFKTDLCGATPLMRAAYHGNLEMVEFLYENGADINAKDYCGYNALTITADIYDDSQFELFKFLMDNGCDPLSVTNAYENTVELLYNYHDNVAGDDDTNDNIKMKNYYKEKMGDSHEYN